MTKTTKEAFDDLGAAWSRFMKALGDSVRENVMIFWIVGFACIVIWAVLVWAASWEDY